MKLNNLYGTIVSMYLAKYDIEGVRNLGYKNFSEASDDISKKIGLEEYYLKLSRDEFDPFFVWRKGFWKRPFARRCLSVMEYFNSLSEENFRDIVIKIINNNSEISESDFMISFVDYFQKEENRKEKIREDFSYVPTRGITGRFAEEYFLKHYEEFFPGYKIKDCRHLGCGYDFEIAKDIKSLLYVEVKGLSTDKGGFLFTDKEWNIAKEKHSQYILFVLKSISSQPSGEYIIDPYNTLNAKKNIYTALQVNWFVNQ